MGEHAMSHNPIHVAERQEHRDAVNALTETDRIATWIDVQLASGVGGSWEDARYDQ